MKVVFKPNLGGTLSATDEVVLTRLAYGNEFATDLAIDQNERSMQTNFDESLWLDREIQAGIGSPPEIGPFFNSDFFNTVSRLTQTLTFQKIPESVFSDFETKILFKNKYGYYIIMENYYETYSFFDETGVEKKVDHRTYVGKIVDYRIKRYTERNSRNLVDISITFKGSQQKTVLV